MTQRTFFLGLFDGDKATPRRVILERAEVAGFTRRQVGQLIRQALKRGDLESSILADVVVYTRKAAP